MSKRKGPVLINDLLPKLARQTASRPDGTAQTAKIEAAQSAYQFISESYKSTYGVAGKPTELGNETNKTVSKVVANNKQSGSEPTVKVEANDEQTVSKVVADSNMSPLVRFETVSATVSSPEANRKQSGSKVVANTPISALVGLQRSILFLVFNECQLCRGEISPPLSLEHIASHCESTEKTAKNAIYRLIQKNFLTRAHYKDGRGGWTQYKLSKEVFQDILHHETVSKVEANRKQSSSATVSATVSSSPSSSSFLESKNFKTTTTGEPELFDDARVQLSPDWSAVDTSPLAEIGFTHTHLMQLAKYSKLSAAEVESSMAFFAFDLRRNGKAKTLNGSPLNFFMGILRKGVPYAPPENFESAADEARRRTREILERKEQERLAEEQRIMDLEFGEWRRGFPVAELARLLPDWAQKPGQIQDSALRSHFDDKVWPEREAARVGVSEAERVEIRTAVEQSLGEARA